MTSTPDPTLAGHILRYLGVLVGLVAVFRAILAGTVADSIVADLAGESTAPGFVGFYVLTGDLMQGIGIAGVLYGLGVLCIAHGAVRT